MDSHKSPNLKIISFLCWDNLLKVITIDISHCGRTGVQLPNWEMGPGVGIILCTVDRGIRMGLWLGLGLELELALDLKLKLDLKPGHSHPKGRPCERRQRWNRFSRKLGQDGQPQGQQLLAVLGPRPSVLCSTSPHSQSQSRSHSHSHSRSRSCSHLPPAPAPGPPVILAVMDMVQARAVFVPEVLVDGKGILDHQNLMVTGKCLMVYINCIWFRECMLTHKVEIYYWLWWMEIISDYL